MNKKSIFKDGANKNLTHPKNKRGISLIVLVITIIVMIILATAIILSLNNSGIIGKANKAKNDSDTATLKEYVNTLKLDWEFMTEEEKTAAGSFSEYATSKLEEKGYNRMVTEDGVILTEGATAAVKAGIKVGDEVTGYNAYLTSKTESTSGDENTAPTGKSSEGTPTEQNISNRTDFVWKYVGMNDNGEIMIVPVLDEDSPTIHLSGKGGYLNGPSELDDMCDKLYTVTGKGTARSINIDDIYSSEKGTVKEGYCIVEGGSSSYTSLTIAQLEEKYNAKFKDSLLPKDNFDLGSCVSTFIPHYGSVPGVFAMYCTL